MGIKTGILESLLILGLASANACAEPTVMRRTLIPVAHRPVSVALVSADLGDPQTVVSMRFAKGELSPNCHCEAFGSMTDAAGAAAMANGTFFSVRSFDTLGNVVVAGQLVQFRDWDRRGSALTIGFDGHARINTLKSDGLPDYRHAWLSLASGPRLLRQGKVWLRSYFEGFRDPALFGRHVRTAVGITRDGRRLVVACFLGPITLLEEAQAMRDLGLYDAINLDGGPSVGLSYRGKVLCQPHWSITNALVIYDSVHPAPSWLQLAHRDAAGAVAGKP